MLIIMPRPLIAHLSYLFFFSFLSVSVSTAAALVQNVTVDALGNTDHADFQTNGSPQYLPATQDWTFTTGRSNDAQALSVRTHVQNATLVLTTAQPTTAFFWRGYLPGTAARYSVCIDCSSVDELGDIITLTSEDTTTDGNRSSPVILFASKPLTNTTHTVALRNLRNTIDGVVGQLIVDAFIFTADVSSQSTGSGSDDDDGTKTSRALMAGIVAIAVILGLCLIFAALFWLLWRRRGGIRGTKRSKSIPPPIPYSVSPPSPGSGGGIGGGETSDPLVQAPPSRSFLGFGVARARVGTTFTSVGRSVVALVPVPGPVPRSLWKRMGMGKGRKRGESESSPMIERERERDWERGMRETKTKPDVVELELPIHAKLAQAHRSLSLSRFRATAPRFPPPPPPPKLKLKEGSTSPNPADLAEAVAATTTNSTSSFSRFAGSLYWKKSRQSTGGKSRRNSMVSTSSVTIPPPPPPPFPIKATNNRTTPPPPLPFITVTSPTTVPTSASTYSTFSLSQTTHDLSRRSDPYAAYAAIYAPYYATGMENEGGEEGEDGRRGGPGGFRRKSNKRSSTVASAVAVAAAAGVVDDSSISQLSQKYRSGSALRDSVVLPGLLEMPGQPRQEREREQEREQEQEDRALVSTNSRPRPHLPPTSTSTSLRSNSSSRPSGPLPPPPSSSSTTAFSNNLASSSSSARAPPSSFNSRVLRMGVQQGQELDGGNEGGDDDGDEGNRAGVKGKRTLSDKIKRGTLPLIPLHFGGGDQQQQQQQEDEEDKKKKKKKRDSFSGSSKRSSTSSILSFASRNSSSVSLVSKRLSTTKNNNNNNNGATTSKRRSSVLRKRRPPSLRGGSKESVDTTSNGNGNENDRDGDDDDDGDEKMVISLMPTFSSRSSLSLSSHLLLDGGMSHGGQRRHPTTAQSQFQRRNHSNPTLVSTSISLTQSRSEPLPSDVPSRQQERSRLNNEEVTSPPSTDSASLVPTNLSLQSPPLPVDGDASSSLLPKETTSPSSHLPEGIIISPSSPPTDEKTDRNERDEILPYLAEDISLPVEEEVQSEPLQRQSMATSQNHSHSSVFMSMLTLQSTDSSNNHSDSHLRGTHSANTRISMKTPRSSLVSKTERSSMMSNGPTPSVSEFPMPPFLTADAASMPSFDLYRSNTVNTTQSHRTSSGVTTTSNNMDAMSGEGLTGSGTATGTLTDLVVSTPSSSSGSFRKSIPIRLAGATGGAASSSIGVTPPSAFPFAYRPPPRPKRNRALGAALLGLDVPASVQSRAPIVRRNSSRSNKGMGISKAPRRRDNLPFRGGPIPTRGGRGSLSNDQENVSTGTSSNSFFIPPPPSSNDHGSHLEQPSRGPSRLTMTSAITSTTDEEYAHGEVQLLTARREYPPGIPDVPTRAIGPETEDSLSVHEQRPISGTTTDSKWEMMFPGLPPGMTPILTSGGSGSHRSGGPPNAAVPVSARTDAFERATVEMSPKSNRIDPALSRNPSIGTLSVGNMRLDATAGLPWSPNFDWPASPTFTNFSNRRPSLPFSSSGLLPTNVQETTARESEDKGKNSFPPFNNVAGASSKAPNMSSVPLQSLSWKDLMGPRSGPQVDPIDTANRPSVRQSTYSVASTFFGGEKSQADGTATPLDPSSPLVIPPVPPLPTRFSRSSAMIDSSPRRIVAPLNLNFKPSWNVRTLSPHSPSSSPQQPSTPQRAARAIGTLNDVFATSWNSGSTRYSSGPGATRILTPKTSEQESRSEQGTPVRSFPQRGVPFP
ncbi:hypothetical protein FRC14_000023 [Serendipita sp. 396]|nr:hypothetical protein FRC14_000023 [Serendipita sp. 396]KAG8789897.1 hypothetical protein FRC15_000089 [Serendipita sp. 397]KAG8879432.1 hypothetical protein FRC20_000004 [Serendipita sp. 405]